MGVFAMLREAFRVSVSFDKLDDEFYDGLEEALILADIGAEAAVDTVAQLRKRVGERLLTRSEEVKDALRDILRSKLEVGDSALVLEGKPAVVLVIGVNGVGKTTSIGKLAARLKAEGKKVLLCAGTRSVRRRRTSWRYGPGGPAWTSCGSTRALTLARCCLTLCRRPRPGARTWCCATRRGGCTTSRT